MKIIRHDAYIATKKRNAKLVALVGFLMLTGTLFLALKPNLIVPSYLFMLFGFVIFNVGMQQVGKWTRNPRNDQVIDHHLKSLPDRYAMVHYAPVGSKRVEHLLIHAGGILTLTAKEIDGVVEQKGAKWRRRSGGLRRFFTFSGPQLGNPSIETQTTIGTLKTFLADKQFEVEVEGAVVFVHPQTELHIEEPDYPVLHSDELPSFVSSMASDESLTAKDREQLIALFASGVEVQAAASTARRRPVKRRAA